MRWVQALTLALSQLLREDSAESTGPMEPKALGSAPTSQLSAISAKVSLFPRCHCLAILAQGSLHLSSRDLPTGQTNLAFRGQEEAAKCLTMGIYLTVS